MVHIGKSLVTSYYDDKEFVRASILESETVMDLTGEKLMKPARKNGIRRKRSQAKARKSIKF